MMSEPTEWDFLSDEMQNRIIGNEQEIDQLKARIAELEAERDEQAKLIEQLVLDSGDLHQFVDRIKELEAEREWIPVSERLPTKTGIYSKPVFVSTEEFGFPRTIAVAVCWISVDNPLLPKWFIDKNFYNLDRDYEIIITVTHWKPIPEPPEVKE